MEKINVYYLLTLLALIWGCNSNEDPNPKSEELQSFLNGKWISEINWTNPSAEEIADPILYGYEKTILEFSDNSLFFTDSTYFKVLQKQDTIVSWWSSRGQLIIDAYDENIPDNRCNEDSFRDFEDWIYLGFLEIDSDTYYSSELDYFNSNDSELINKLRPFDLNIPSNGDSPNHFLFTNTSMDTIAFSNCTGLSKYARIE